MWCLTAPGCKVDFVVADASCTKQTVSAIPSLNFELEALVSGGKINSSKKNSLK